MLQIISAVILSILLSACVTKRQSIQTEDWHPASAGRASWGLVGVTHESLSAIHLGMTRAEIKERLQAKLTTCFEAPRFVCMVTTDSPQTLHIALRFDGDGRLDGISAKPITLTYSRLQR